MSLTISEMTPVALCIATQELLDAKRYCQNFGDNMLLRVRDKGLEQYLVPFKRELNSNDKKFLEGHRAAVISNIDKIVSLVSSRYAQIDYKAVESIVNEGKSLIKKLLFVENFQQMNSLEPVFRSKISLPVYSLFLESMKRKAV